MSQKHNFDTKQNNNNIQNTKQKIENTSGCSKNIVDPNITQQQKTPAVNTYLQTYQFANEISIQKKTYIQFPVPNNFDNMSTFTTISLGAIQRVTRPNGPSQEPF